MKERNDIIAYLLDSHLAKDQTIAGLQEQVRNRQAELAALKSQETK